MIEIRLDREGWFYDEGLASGPAGGFGAVFAGQATGGRAVAVKRLNLDVEASAGNASGHADGTIQSFGRNDERSLSVPSCRCSSVQLSNTMHSYQAAFGPTSIDDENEDSFIDRWMVLFGAAAEGRLKHPSRPPLAPDFWRNLSPIRRNLLVKPHTKV
jgi:hypothetical protein